ncbi:uncharacterized protein LOC122570710 [Bombus pyrosoma]|uniref:uncharacterized protein LOC122570710 n=1 Tax=Bombus pyrosoma TaxID=396416 RepID=UPI001CB92A09|nr:uncharacterized protein LOC122570710 [Bombus pyrosoma]XP_043589376.1 uncharacterized protein LOC122570710 [Bombus pyrosoma]XP_043589377.1 uncharacterized protein LOC122570710 [Bombus pyrosoma]
MNYGGNMPDWHQYNASQTNEVTPSAQNVNSGHLSYIPGASPPTLNAISLSSEGLNKHQNDASYNPRNYQSFNNVSNGSTIPNNSPLVSMVQMQNCIGHYGSPNTRNPMLDNINASVDPRNTNIGTINDDVGYRSNQGPFNGPIGHLNGASCNLNTSSGPRTGLGPIPGPRIGPGSVHGPRTNSGPGIGTNPNTGTGPMFGPGSRHGPVSVSGSSSGAGNMGPRNTNVGPLPPSGKPVPPSSFIPCKGMCCNSDPNINYQQWEKYGSYQNNGSYRDNVHPSNYQIENRQFGNNCNFRKDNLESKEVMSPVLPNASTVDHRRNFADYKYHKDHIMHRNYSTSSGIFHNYSMQGYNYSTEQQKYPYPVKEHTKTNSMNMPNSGMLKQQEQNFIAQQKFNSKQCQYQNGNMIPKGMPTVNVNANMVSSSQNSYFNSQYPRNIPAEISHECQETTNNTAMMNKMQNTFMHNSPPQHQVYQHKIAMQKFSIENHLRELSRIPGYQSHPKYKECILRYREVLKLQQSSGYQNPVQQTPRVTTPVNTAVPPINLQFDQNGMLINSSYLPDNFSKVQHAPPTIEQAPENMDKQNKDQDIAMANEKCQQSQQPEQLIIPQQNEHVPSSCTETFQKQNQFSIHKDFNQNQLKVQTSESHTFNTLSTNTSNETMMQQKASKEFANKPDLDVRQFLANWDETDDEEGTTNIPDTILSETTPVVVVSYENIDLSSKTPQGSEVPRKNGFCSNETLESNKQSETNVIAAQDCLTISYSASDNSEIAKTSKRTIGEGVVKPGSIIHCISNGPDEIPTIHIVDNLEIANILGAPNGQVIQALEKQKTIPFFRGPSNNEIESMAVENTEQQGKSNTHILSVDYPTSLGDMDKNTNMENSSISETTTIPINNQGLRVLSTSEKDNLDVSDNIELKKQHSFEESHNPDDISLPDLPTSECTPISTTLNTPIHSDTEESSQNMEDLSISTNMIEVMQNSPVISFTQLNSEDKVKNRSLGTLELEFQKENRYKNNETKTGHAQEETLNNFELSNNSKVKSNEIIKNKQMKNLGTTAVRKKVCLADSKENDARVSDACGVLTSMEYELEEVVEGKKRSDLDSPDYSYERGHKNIRRSTETIRPGIEKSKSNDNIDSNANLSPTISDDESQALKNDKELRRKKIKTSIVSTNVSCSTPSELDLDVRKRAREAITWEEKCIDKYLDRNLSQKRDADHLKQSKVSDTRKLEDSSSSQGGEHSVCHMTSQYKHYSAAVIKDNVTLNNKRTHGTTDRVMSEKSSEFPTKINNTNTKELSEEAEIRKRVSSKIVSTLQENIQSQTSKLLQKDLKSVDGDVTYTAEEMRLLKEYRKKKEKSYQAHDTYNDNNKDEKSKSKSYKLGHKVCLEQNSVSPISLNSENLMTQEESKSHSCSKNLIKNADFDIQVANVNLKIKDSDIGKELLLGDKSQEHIKDPLEGIKIEINVSCTDRNSKGQEQNKRIFYDDRSLYEIDDSLSYSNTLDCQRRLHAKEQEGNPKLPERAHRLFEKSDAVVDVTETNQGKSETETNLRITLKKDRRASLETSEEINPIISKETCNLISDNQSFSKSSRNNAFCKDISKAEIIEDTSYATDHVDIIKSKSAISNTATIDANNKVKGKNKFEDDKEDNFICEDDDQLARIQKQGSTNFVNISNIIEKEIASVSHSRTSIKLPESNFIELKAKSLNNLSNLDFKFGKYTGIELDHGKRMDEELDEEEDYTGKWKKPKIDDIFEDCDMFQSSSGYVNPIFSSIDKLEDLHTVPVYTTKDGKISYSPNRRFTYHELMMEARKRESYSSVKKSHYTDTWNNYYNSKFRKMYKKKRHHSFNDKKKYEYKNTKYLYDRKRNYSDEFYGKSHVKYKDYVHSIRNNNAIWSDHYKMDKMYSSSDSDEQIMDRSKNRVAEGNNCKKDHIIENKSIAIPKPQKDEVFIDELDLECKSKKNVTDDISHKDNGMDLEEAQVVQFRILDIDKKSENCVSANINCIDNYISRMDSDILSTSLQSKQKKQNVENNVNESLMLDNSEITSENFQTNKDKNSGNECTDQIIDKVEIIATLENEEKNVVPKNESPISKLLIKESLLDKDKQVSLHDLEKKKNDEKITSEGTDAKEQKEEIDINLSDSQISLESKNDLKNIENTESNNKSETNYVSGPMFETDIIKEVSELQIDSNYASNQVSQEFSFSKRPKVAFNEIIEESEQNISQENISKCEEETVQFNKEVEISSEDQEHEEDINKVKEGNNEDLEDPNNDTLLKDTSAMNQKESESQAILINKTINQEDNTKHISIECIEHEDNIDVNSDQINNVITEKESSIGPSKDEIHTEDENIAEIGLNRSGIEIILSNDHIEETSVEQDVITDDLKDEGGSDDLPVASKHETNSNQDTLEDKGIPVLNTCCFIKNSPTVDAENNKDKSEIDEQKEEQIPVEQAFSKSSTHSSDIDMIAIPKLVIKKTDASNSKPVCSLDYMDSSETCDRYDAKLLSEVRPKIPKVIIMKNRSRSVTPTVEILEKTKSDKTQSFLPEQNEESMDMDNSDFESYTLKYDNYENKVPKVRIKLEDISSKDLKVYLKRKTIKKNIPKVKIKKLKMQESKRIKMKESSESEDTDSDEDTNFHESMSSDIEVEKTSKSKIKKQEESRSLSPEKDRGNDSNIPRVSSKKTKRIKENDSKHTAKYDNNIAINDELKKKFPQCIMEKIPKVIIKRTQIGTEFKCEISKSKKTSITETSKWQPKVKLQRLDVLDHMVKDWKHSKITLSDKFDLSAQIKDISNEDVIDDNKVKLPRSNSVSSLSPAKCKQRRLSDSDYMKINSKSTTEFDANLSKTDNVATLKSDDSESRNIKRKGKRKLFSQTRQIHYSQNDESESEMGETETKHSFKDILTNEDNGMMVVKEEYSTFGTKENTLLIEDKFLDSVTRSHNYNDNNSSIIKVDSSDESQTTIEILPASPDNSDNEVKNSEFENISRIDMVDAMPTQLELELELIDNKNICSEVFTSKIDYASHSKSKYIEGSTKAFFNKIQHASQNSSDQNEYTFLMNKQQLQNLERRSNDNFYCNDLLIKEVLAAKETLKKCLTKSENEDAERKKSRHRTVAEKKQGSSFTFKDIGKSLDKSEKACSNSQNDRAKVSGKSRSSEKEACISSSKMDIKEVKESCSKQNEIYSMDCPTASTYEDSNVLEPTTISLKASKKFDEITANTTSVRNSGLSNRYNNTKDLQKEKSVKKTSSSNENQKDNDNSNDTKIKEDNMPLLVPEFVLNFDSSSDRDSSRSPPVITNQEEVEHVVEDAKLMENKAINQMEKIEENKKHSYKDCGMTIADIIMQLAYHEKATIKHKRYCNLCERWFPTTSRHRRHLAGYQHRYMESTQRKSIHTLFILFTGKPCPRLLPANVIRNDCSIGELTPLQIAVQDVAKCVEYIQQDHKTKE